MSRDHIDQAARRAALEHYFGLWRSLADLLLILLDAKGPLTRPQLAVMCSATQQGISNRIVRLREALNSEAIDREEQYGYRLTDTGRAEIEGAMVAMARSLVA